MRLESSMHHRTITVRSCLLLFGCSLLLAALLLPAHARADTAATAESTDVAPAADALVDSLGMLASAGASSSSASLVCLNGGVLLRTPAPPAPGAAASADLVSVQCACASGWSGSTCQWRDWCALANPCLNGGQCFNTRSGALCHCTPEWAGGTCAQRSPCAGDPCSGHGTCLLREVADNTLAGEGGSSSAPNEALSALLPERKLVSHSTTAAAARKKHGAEPPAGSSPELLSNTTGILSLNSVVTGHCRCDLGWTGADCSQEHAKVCAEVPRCTIFNAPADDGARSPLCGCEAAIAQHRCTWCLEQGVAFAPGLASPQSSSCQAPLSNVRQCPPAAAQAIHSCSHMEGTPFGWCVVSAGPLGYAVDGNPTAPTAGSRKCHHWIWTQDGCKPEWGTRDPSVTEPKQEVSAEECSAVPPCSDAETAGSSLCGCQAALSIGCTWCLEQQLAYAPSKSNSSLCRALASSVAQCPSQQAQTVHACVGVGGTPYGWCAIDADEPGFGYSLEGNAKSPGSNPHQCTKWIWFSNACPEQENASLDDKDQRTTASTVRVRTAARISAAAEKVQSEDALVLTDDPKDKSGSSTDADADDVPALPPAVMSDKDARAAVVPPKHLSHMVRNYMAVWFGLVTLALFLRWLPHCWERNEYQHIRDVKPAPAFREDTQR